MILVLVFCIGGLHIIIANSVFGLVFMWYRIIKKFRALNIEDLQIPFLRYGK